MSYLGYRDGKEGGENVLNGRPQWHSAMIHLLGYGGE